MSRGFVREDDKEEPPFIPPRAPLPDGVANYVTPRGLEQLRHERQVLEQERQAAQGSEYDRRRRHAEIDGRLALLQERLSTARVVEPPTTYDEVRFGCTVTLRYLNGEGPGDERQWTIVGVDEASVKEQRIAFTSPLARALMGKRVGDEILSPGGPRPIRALLLHIA